MISVHNHNYDVTVIFIDPRVNVISIFICAYTLLFHIHVLVLAYNKDHQHIQTCVLIVIIVVQQNTMIKNFYKLGSIAPIKTIMSPS